jgi:hypothetical protein
MNKYLVIITFALGLTSCGVKDEQYYRSNPKELQRSIKKCPEIQPNGFTCPQIQALGNRLNQLAYQLQFNPQEFGNKILALQELIAKQKTEIKANNSNTNLKLSLEKNEDNLADYMAVVKWLESPES